MRASRGFGSRSGAFTSPLPSSFPPRRACLRRASVAPADWAPSASAIGRKGLAQHRASARPARGMRACRRSGGGAEPDPRRRDRAHAQAHRRPALPRRRGEPGVGADLHRQRPGAERLRRRRAEHLHQHRDDDRGSDRRPAPRGDRPRARPSHRRAPDPARRGAAGRAGHRRHRDARRARRRGGRRAGGERSPSPPEPRRWRSGARSPTAAATRRAPTRRACATSPRRAATRRRCSTCSTISAARTRCSPPATSTPMR